MIFEMVTFAVCTSFIGGHNGHVWEILAMILAIALATAGLVAEASILVLSGAAVMLFVAIVEKIETGARSLATGGHR